MFCKNNDNSQTWVRARNLKVDNSRVNITPQKLDNSIGLYSKARRKKIKLYFKKLLNVIQKKERI